MSEEQKLEPCPFCGSAASITEDQNGVATGYAPGCSDAKCPCSGRGAWYPTRPMAVSAWNRRAPQPFTPTHRHYKGGLYQKLLTGWHSETQEALTIYRNEAGAVWARPTEMFESEAPPSPGAGARPRRQRFEPIP